MIFINAWGFLRHSRSYKNYDLLATLKSCPRFSLFELDKLFCLFISHVFLLKQSYYLVSELLAIAFSN